MNLCSIWSRKNGKEIEEEGCNDPSSNNYASIFYTKLLYILKIHDMLFKCIWLVFLSPLVSGLVPTMPQFIKVKLPSRVGPKVTAFGTILLQDDLGNKMEIIRGNHQGRQEDMTVEVLREWLAGKGMEVSWESLIATLRDCELSLMADQIQMALDQLISWCIVLLNFMLTMY